MDAHTTHHLTPLQDNRRSLRKLAFSATIHCLTGCSIGEILGMVIGTSLGWSNGATITISIALAFVFGYTLTMLPLRKAGLTLAAAIPLALASDTISITIMEIVDNAIMLVIPGAMEAPLSSPLFWGSLLTALVLAGLAALPVNYWLIARGKGHAVVHAHHGHGVVHAHHEHAVVAASTPDVRACDGSSILLAHTRPKSSPIRGWSGSYRMPETPRRLRTISIFSKAPASSWASRRPVGVWMDQSADMSSRPDSSVTASSSSGRETPCSISCPTKARSAASA